MLKAGAPREDIHSELLMHKKPDGFWRKEIDDSGAELTGRTMALELSDFVTHPELFMNSQINNTLISPRTEKTLGSATGQYIPGSKGDEVFLGREPEIFYRGDLKNPETKATIFHEMQHGIQETERWASGGSPSEFSYDSATLKTNWGNKYYGYAQDENLMNTLDGLRKNPKSVLKLIKEDPETYQKASEIRKVFGEIPTREKLIQEGNKLFKEAEELTPYKQYQNLLGEREARDTASRMNLTLDERRGLMPDFGDDAIVRMP